MSSRIIRPTPPGDAGSPERGARIGRFVFGSAAGPSTAREVPQAAPEGPLQTIPAATSDPDSVQKQCERWIEEARLKVSEIEKEAYAKGFAEGQKAGSEIGEKMAEALLKQYSSSLDALNTLRREIFSTSEREVIRLSLEIARKIIKREAAIDEELILTLVKVALARVADQALITVRMNPKDYHFVERRRAAGLSDDSGVLGESVKLVEDPLISRGGCVIETESGTIDARIEEQLREIEKGFFE